MNELQKITELQKAIDQAKRPDELMNLRDSAETMRVWLKRRNAGLETINFAVEAKIRSERKLGKWLIDNINHKGGKPLPDVTVTEDIVNNRKQSKNFQDVAKIPDLEFEELLAKLKAKVDAELTSNIFYRFGMSGQDFTMPDLPEGKFNVIYADPPWQYDNSIRKWGPANLHYPTMSFEALCEFIDKPDKKGRLLNECIADNAVMFLWVTNPFMWEGLQLLEAWSFDFKTSMVWVKRNLKKPGSGFYVRGHHEHLFIATRGSMLPDQKGKKPVSSVIDADIGEHSAKPEAVYEMIENLYPQHKYLELFGRKKRPGWEVWGNEIT